MASTGWKSAEKMGLSLGSAPTLHVFHDLLLLCIMPAYLKRRISHLTAYARAETDQSGHRKENPEETGAI